MLIRGAGVRFSASAALAGFLFSGFAADAWLPPGSRGARGGTNQNQVRFEVKTNYYHVTGSSAPEVRQSLNAVRPHASPFDAWTDWSVRCTCRPRREGGRFVLDSFEIRGQATLMLPSWSPKRKSDPGLREAWWAYLKALAAHEQGHLAIAREAVAEAEKRLLALPGFATAREFSVAADQAVQQATREARAKECDYDRRTRHGAVQGALFRSDPR